MARLAIARKRQGLWKIASASHVGRVRSHNEDSYTLLDTTQLGGIYDFALIVADGMGGRNAGEIASKAAVEAVSWAILKKVTVADAEALLRFAVEAAHNAIQQKAAENPQYEGMGTTLVIALVKEENLWVAHVGDSRAYLLRQDRLMPLTEDHTFVAEQVRTGGMSLEQARHSRFRHMLTRAVGTNADYTPDIETAELEPRDVLLLCTDGLTNMLSDQEIARLVRKHRTQPERACQSLIDAANASGGQDNITVMLAADMREAPPANGDDGELQTLSDFPTVPEPLSRLARLTRHLAPRWGVLAAAAILVLMIVIWLGSTLSRKQPVPSLPPPPPVVDLANVRYAEPQILLNKPLRGAPLVVDPQGRIYAMSQQGRVLCISPEGEILKVAREPFAAAADPAIKPDVVHFATDAQGNLYVCDQANRRISKYRPDGTLVGNIGEGRLKRPTSIAVAADGSVYVIDAGKVTVFRAIQEGRSGAAQPHR